MYKMIIAQKTAYESPALEIFNYPDGDSANPSGNFDGNQGEWDPQ